ncbi:MAG: stage III sporulation protein AG [Oscillospiraceae bacterium]|nr:stage III sporulation protein AG [Oscillospiraceae bacterium]
MELKKLTSHIKVWADKYKYVILVLLIGVILMWLPENKEKGAVNNESASITYQEIVSIDTSMSDILSLIDGAGRVEVMLTKAKGEETLYQEDIDESFNESGEDMRSDTVIISDSQRMESGLVKQVNPPIYMGAIVVCEGADDPTVKLAIVDAVSKLTGLGADKICVLKMK